MDSQHKKTMYFTLESAKNHKNLTVLRKGLSWRGIQVHVKYLLMSTTWVKSLFTDFTKLYTVFKVIIYCGFLKAFLFKKKKQILMKYNWQAYSNSLQ